MFKKISCALTAGAIGAVFLNFVVSMIYGFDSSDDFQLTLYRLMLWSCLWSLLLVVPKFDKKKWFLKTSIIATLAILFNFIILMPFHGVGLFAYYAPASIFLGNIIFNAIWCLTAGYWYHLCIDD
ncbi:MAG: membrane lipoprotein [Gammaproteobacteria bacterium]|nr:MAG: membrane lipoprotein [Gammaproteobacteria bacterium]UTW42696.1 membrane lipoprotein [bacterium SCSIO 12844]